jgi:transcriptional regulator with XRE-family HTH domain
MRNLKAVRRQLGLTQQQAGRKLGISQPYLSLLEKGKRTAPPSLARKLVNLYGLSPAALPLERMEHFPARLDAHKLAEQIAGLGYPGLAYLRCRPKRNPAQILLSVLAQSDVETRLVEALPWIVYRYELDWGWLLTRVKQFDLQNRLGYTTHLARALAQAHGDIRRAKLLEQVEARLDRARLAREDTLCRDSLGEVERRWLRKHRPPAARHWSLLTDLRVEHLIDAA